jgi:hypothetical protein
MRGPLPIRNVSVQAGGSETPSGRDAPRDRPSRRSAGSQARRARRLPGERGDRPPRPPCRSGRSGSGHGEVPVRAAAAMPASIPCGPGARGRAGCADIRGPSRPSTPVAPSRLRVYLGRQAPACTGAPRSPRGQAKLGGEPPRLPPAPCVPRLAGLTAGSPLGQSDPAAPAARHGRVRLRLADALAGGEVDEGFEPGPLRGVEHGPDDAA